uniref:Cyanobacterial aminoacyl-tRNA synthetase CAAD domain-containing protein n=1 Tax=Dunaliella tertiolecta TaxID=3047 RepID=A0A7S3QKW2_DUNTE|eukprot:CAMPEP_0202350720 /NCGR_PEP_ID=MMETSP1126-20121109/7675_1 /ASSEMBLY_ACC=CAM_ASM_000457 /TAXON_ID=3047 /ORGANISM="Dunaliella tertiolecta, Strain CCMP1320" /LENGTH=172 /DNA_ID=CAMNT_0048942739 /DNA_START=48 /DNA_END=566 /DNA_ORIENTATION=+
MALKAAAQTQLAQTTRVQSTLRAPVVRPTLLSRRAVLVRAEEKKAEAPQAEAPKVEAKAPSPPTPSSSGSDDEMTKKVEELFAKAQQKWDETSDSEKPAAIAIVIAVIVAQVAIGASVEAVERIPLLSPFLEFVGFAVTSVYAYRYATDPAEREGVQASIDSFTKAVTGKKV